MFFGTSREKLLDRADPSLSLSPLVTQFGHYIKIVVKEEDKQAQSTARRIEENWSSSTRIEAGFVLFYLWCFFDFPIVHLMGCNLKCFDPVEKLYYSAGYSTICIYCAGSMEGSVPDAAYPQCIHCASKPKVARRWTSYHIMHIEFFVSKCIGKLFFINFFNDFKGQSTVFCACSLNFQAPGEQTNE